jgi:PAT family beta-lactamase induction signal transducer AmpG
MSLPSQTERGRAGALVDALAVYFRARVAVVLLLGFSSGLPLALSGETLRVWMADRGVDLGTIGLLSLAGLPYTIKFIWAPVVDALEVPWLSQRLGRRRGWLVASQLLLMAAIVFLGTRDPIAAPLVVGLGALLVAFASATQDIVIDAYRVESLPTDEQAAGMAGYVAAYRIGMLASGAGVIGLSAWLEAQSVSKVAVWPIVYGVAAALVIVGLLAVLAGTMTAPFVLSLGYDKGTYAAIVKGVGLAALLVGGFAGGVVARAMPLAGALWLGAILQMVSNLAFVWLHFQPAGAWALTVAIVVENFTGAIGTVIFVAYLSALCGNPLHTATQYALLTALASTGRTFLSSGSGFVVNAIGWPLFFIVTTLVALPALALLAWLQRRRHFEPLDTERNGAK